MRSISLIILLVVAVAGQAQISLDSTKVAGLYSTTWQLSYKMAPKRGLFFKWHKPVSNEPEVITIYQNEFHTSTNNGPYIVCPMRHRNQNELWLDCKESNQVIYRVVSFYSDMLTLDMLVKKKDKNGYQLVSRKHYTRKKD